MGCNITVLIPDVRGKQASPGLGCFKTGQRLHRVGVHTGPVVLTQTQQDRTAQLPVINMTDRDITIKAGINLGTIASLEEGTAYIASLNHKDPGLTTRKKKEEYIQNFICKPRPRPVRSRRLTPLSSCRNRSGSGSWRPSV